MNNLGYFRELKNLSQRDLAEMIGVSQPTIQRAETEDDSAKLGTYKKCAVVLGVTLSDIFSDRSIAEQAIISIYRASSLEDREKMVRILRAVQDADG